jgi:hypothetical protein
MIPIQRKEPVLPVNSTGTGMFLVVGVLLVYILFGLDLYLRKPLTAKEELTAKSTKVSRKRFLNLRPLRVLRGSKW